MGALLRGAAARPDGRRARASRSGRGAGRAGSRTQSIFHLSQFTLLLHDFERSGNNLGLPYFHGRPGTPGMPEFDACFETMRARHAEIDRIQVTNRDMEALVLSTGIGAGEGAPHPDRDRRRRVSRCDDAARRAPPACRARAARVGLRRRLVPEGRRGLGRGARAEADQGARRAARRRRRLAERVPELSSCSRAPRGATCGRGSSGSASRTSTSSSRTSTRSRAAYPAIDVCLVASRDEGGPRAVLESMATGRAARHDASRAGAGPRRRRAERHGWSTSRTPTGSPSGAPRRLGERRTSSPSSPPGARPRRRARTTRSRRAGEALLEGFAALPEP